MRVRFVIGNVATGIVLLLAAACIAVAVSVRYRPLATGGGIENLFPDSRPFVAVGLALLALLVLPLAFLARDHLPVRAALTLGGWLTTMFCIFAVANGGSFSPPAVSIPTIPIPVPKTHPAPPGAASLPKVRMTRMQAFTRMLDAGLSVEVHPDRWHSPSLSAFAKGTHTGWIVTVGTKGAPFVAVANTGWSYAPSVLEKLLARDGFTVRSRGFNNGFAFVIADAPGAAPATPARIRAIDRALRG